MIKDAVDNFSLTPQMANLLNSLNNSIPKPGNQTNDTQQNVCISYYLCIYIYLIYLVTIGIQNSGASKSK